MPHVTPRRFFQFEEWPVSKDYPDLAAQIRLSDEDKANIRLWVQLCGDPWRVAHPDCPVHIISGKRSPELNKAVGGADNSDHLYAGVVDAYADNMTASEFFCSIQDQGLPYRELLLYPSERFVHWSIWVPQKSVKHRSKIMPWKNV